MNMTLHQKKKRNEKDTKQKKKKTNEGINNHLAKDSSIRGVDESRLVGVQDGEVPKKEIK